MNRIYLDYAAATPLNPNVAKKMREAEKCFANPSAFYSSGREAKELLDKYRKDIAMFFGANSDEIVFTSGATESNNLAILGAARAAGVGRIISIGTEHASVRSPLQQLQNEGFEVVICKLDKYGRIVISDFEKLLSYDTKLVSINLASSEIGTIQPIRKLSALIRKFEQNNGTKIVFHTDASAAVATLSTNVSQLGIDLLTMSAAKIYGPKGIGILYVRRKTSLAQIFFGGKQEAGLRSGSESLPLVAGLATSLELAKQNKKKDSERYRQLYTKTMLELEGIDFIENGHPDERLFSVLSICLYRVSGENIVAYLDAQGIEVATGAACEASNDQPSAALLAIGRTAEQAQGSLRISFGNHTKLSDIDNLIKCLKNTISTLS